MTTSLWSLPPSSTPRVPMTALTHLTLLASGKVREIYDGGDTLLIVASDRISTYDVIHPNPVPGKGEVLTGLSAFWFKHTAEIVPANDDAAFRLRRQARNHPE